MAQPLTFKQILARIELFANAHQQINDFRFGDPAQWFANNDLKYRALCCDALPVATDAVNKTTSYSFDTWIFDLANVSNKSRQSEIDVTSDLIQIANDAIAFFRAYTYQNDFQMNDITNIQLNMSTGEDQTISVNFVLVFSVDFTANSCQIPLQ